MLWPLGPLPVNF